MNIRILYSVFFLVFLLIAPATQAQIDQSMIQRARSMGISQSQINSFLSGQQTGTKINLNNLNNLNNLGGMNGLGGLNSNLMQHTYRDTSMRREFSIEELEAINPILLEKVISDLIDEQGSYYDVRGRSLYNSRSSLLNSVGTNKSAFGPQASELDYYLQQPRDYEIVIRDGKYIKRPLPVVFGREIFTNRNLTFAPNYNMATPSDYVLGAGDQLSLDIWGNAEMFETLKVTPDGFIVIKSVGPVNVAGLTVQEAQRRVQSKVAQVMAGADAKLTLGQMRTIRVNIAGEVLVPGTYTLPSLSTLFNAMYAAGGVNNIGSLRSVKVFRNSNLIADLDVYDYLLNGRYDTNIRLQDNDMIIVSPYDNFVTVHGKVKRERTYEMKKGETLGQLIDYAGGFRGDAYNDNIQVKRKTGRMYQLLTVERPDFAVFTMSDGDSVFVDRIITEYANRVIIRGAVWRPGEYEFSPQTATLSALINKAEGLKGSEFGSRGQIVRRKKDYTWEMIQFSPSRIVLGEEDIALMPEDSIYIPNILELREDYRVSIDGEVNRPSEFSYRDNMTIEDLILMSGGLKESASLARIEVARRIKDPASTTYSSRTAETFMFGIDENLSVDPAANRFVLNPFDQVFIRRSPAYSEQKSVTITGEVLYEGIYVLTTSGERISDIIYKTGGFTPEAYVRGASVRRRMTQDERAVVESKLLMADQANERDSLMLSALESMTVYPVGVDVEQALAHPSSPNNIILRDGDQIYVPKMNSIVKISGGVLYPNSVAYFGPRVKNYISQAGGYKDMARRRPYVIYMNGKVAATRGRFLSKRLPQVEPGCEVVVPLKQPRDKSGLATTMSILSSTTAMAAMIATIINATK